MPQSTAGINMRRNLLHVSYCLILLATNSLHAQDSQLENDLRSRWIGAVVSLKVPFDAKEIHFDSLGRAPQELPTGHWLNQGWLYVDSLKLPGNSLEFDCRRVVYMNSVSDPTVTLHKVKIVIQLDPSHEHQGQITRVLQEIFEDKDAAAIRLKNYWNENADEKDEVAGTLEGGRTVYRRVLGTGSSPPHPLHSPDPKNPGHEKGLARFWTVLNEQGVPELFRVQRSVGITADQAALDAVSQWKFRPAMRNGIPVCMSINIEINFH